MSFRMFTSPGSRVLRGGIGTSDDWIGKATVNTHDKKSGSHRQLVMVVRRLEEALAILDEINQGDSNSAAYIERAVQRAKRELRTGTIAYPLNPTPCLRARPGTGHRRACAIRARCRDRTRDR